MYHRDSRQDDAVATSNILNADIYTCQNVEDYFNHVKYMQLDSDSSSSDEDDADFKIRSQYLKILFSLSI